MNCKGLAEENCVLPNCKYINGSKRKYCRKNTSTNKNKSSQCKGLAKNNCFQPCKYVDTEKRQYCRISGKKNVEKVENAKNTIRRFITKVITKKRKSRQNTSRKSKSMSEKKEKRSKQIEKVNKAKNTIGNFLYKNREKIRANYLRIVCSDSGVCIAFGKESKKINDFFQFFDNFDYMKNYTVLNSGKNGTIVKIDYERENYKSYAVLKKKINRFSDSLMYEYMVGHFFINNMYKKFPCFLQTYGFVYNDDLDTLKDQKVLNLESNDIVSALRNSCVNPTKLILLLENVSNPITFYDKITSFSQPMLKNFIEDEFFAILFQVYYTLNILKNVFTHYDLHSNNILLYEPITDGYIDYHYHYRGEVITFKSRYIVKIIDYGRCYFRESNINSQDIYSELCKIIECNTNTEKCGDLSGYNFLLKKKKEIRENYYTNSSDNNQSHDLRLLKDLSQVIPKIKKSSEINNSLNSLKFLLKKIKYNRKYGTPQLLTSGAPTKINNVIDAFLFIKGTIISLPIPSSFDGLNKSGDLNIYDDGRDMVFTEHL
jgi:hypothetical protein